MPLVLGNNLSRVKPKTPPKAWDLEETLSVVLSFLMEAAKSGGGAREWEGGGAQGGGRYIWSATDIYTTTSPATPHPPPARRLLVPAGLSLEAGP